MPEPETETTRYGEPGAPISRQTPFNRGFLFTLGGLSALVLGFAVDEAASVLVLVLISAFLAVGLDPVVAFAVRRGMKRGWAVVAVAVLFFGVITAVVFVIGGALESQVTSLVDNAPRLLDDLRRNRSVAKLDHKYHVLSGLQDRIQDANLSSSTLSRIFDVGISVLNLLLNTVVVVVLTLYFLSALPQLKKGMYSLAPASRRDRVEKLGDAILRSVGGYVIGAVGVALLAGTVTLVLLLCVGLSAYALPLALLVALLDLVPLLGSIVGASVVSLVGFATSLSTGIACVLFYAVYEALEGYVIYPRVMRSSVDIPEYLTIVAVLIGGAVGGIVGALLALPTAAALLLIVREVWVRRQDVS
ncbi:MAG: AI-2E family transporter [Jatrophihabitans sp.]|uniref:AI-2E family transporter n=1 Tax=Jatrophihabitans sp. TaxID=1932789 RepID=UPI0039119EC2